MKVAWGITGSGDKMVETLEIMKEVRKRHQEVDIRVFLSKAGDMVVRWYRLNDDLRTNFERVLVEVNPNAPFLAGDLQLGRYAFFLIAPATSNTVAKISLGIGDSLLTNAAIMALKAFVPVYMLPSDYEEGIVTTRLPSGKDLKLRIRKEDAEHVRKLEKMEDVHVLRSHRDILDVFSKHF